MHPNRFPHLAIVPASAKRPLRQRRDAANRMVALECGCVDPITCRCAPTADVDTSVQPLRLDLDSMAAAADVLIRRCGRPGIWAAEDVRALWQRNHPGDRVLAERIALLSGWSEDNAVAA